MNRWLTKVVLITLIAIVLSLVPNGVAIQAGVTAVAPQVGDTSLQTARTAQPVLPQQDAAGPRGAPIAGFDISPAAVAAAPGYCASSGGSTQYEYITDANFTQSPGGTWQLEVRVFIANPQGCVAGEPCESYDPSPENVNAWIDWNGDKTWDESERVLDAALTGYTAINYAGTMTAISQFSQPAVVTDTTWARVNLGWGSDPNDPCTPSWTWGNVVDQELNIGGPKIKEVKVTGSKDAKNPMTTYDVELEAVLDVPPDYEIIKVSWSGDLAAGDGNPYTYKPDRGTHGLKKIKATANYRHIPSGATGQVAKEHEFKLFFEKKGDDDGNGNPNWFDYWGTDGAVPGLTNPIVKFDATKGAGQYGSWNPPTDQVDLGAAAAEIHYPGGLNIDGTVYGNVKGIDSVAEVIGHELRHRTTNHNWRTGGPWVGKTDSDKGVPTAQYWDLLPDEYENSFGTDKNKTDSKDLEHKKSAVYKFYGDNEFDAIVAGHGFRGVANKDWANPGSQSDPAFKTLLAMMAGVQTVDTLYATSGPVNAASGYWPQEVVLPGLVVLTGAYTDSGVNSDGDSALEALRISVEVEVTAPDQYSVIGWLENAAGQELAWAQRTTYLNAGLQNVHLDFDGKWLYQAGANTTYTLARVEIRGGEHSDLIDFAEDAHTTGSYAAGDFEPPAVTFTNDYAASRENTNADDLFELLNIDVGVTVHQPGNYTLVGWLYDNAGNPIPGASASVAFNSSGTKRLAFDGQRIRWHRQDGPYVLQLVEVRDAVEERVSFVTNAFTTPTAYDVDQFGPPSAATLDVNSYTDAGEDVNGDGLYDYLAVNVAVDATNAGDYQLLATLKSLDRQYLADIDMPLTLVTGTNPITMHFPGGLIRLLEIDGPYQVEAVALLDDEGATLDYQGVATTTQPYTSSAFAMPLLMLTDQYRDYAADTGGDAGADELHVEVGLVAGNSGVVIAQAQLTDKDGNEIAWATNNMSVTAGVPTSVTLVYSGTEIAAHGQDGPYLVRNLLAYHTGDPSQEVSVADAHITAPYDHDTLEPTVVIGPPAEITVQVQPATMPADGASTGTVLVTVEDADGNPIPSQTVQLAASKGTVTPGSGKSGINGTVAVSLTASTIAGSGQITASAGAVAGSAQITFVAGIPAELTLLVNPTAVAADGTSTISVTAVVRDAYGNLVSGEEVEFGASAGTIGDSATTNSSGAAVTQLVAPSSKGFANVTASVGVLTEEAQVEFVSEPVIFLPTIHG